MLDGRQIVVPIARVAVDSDIALTRVALQEHDGGILLVCDYLCVEQVVVVETPEEGSAVLARTSLQGLVRRDEVGQVCGARAPPHGKDAVHAAQV